MPDFYSLFCHPFLRDPVDYGATDRLEIIRLFTAIPWLRLNQDTFTKQEEMLNDFWYFETGYEDETGLSYTLNIAPEYVPGNELTQEDMRFTIRYIRPRMRKRFMGLGGSRLDKTFLTEWQDCNEKHAVNCLIAFADRDHEFLEEQV